MNSKETFLQTRQSTDRAQTENRQSTDRAKTEHRQSTDREQTEHRQSTDRAQTEQQSFCSICCCKNKGLNTFHRTLLDQLVSSANT
ncbi:hypothetical protein Bpfe_013728 [Biomphalaria pfeifferi]|uniref:Uncharacterized protein n=1 Tax=Biomphalaria pfeifferi TaxID=112525 RepID=A0AAD8BND0_BIOPF|nr:hypothetical protein Bpfe_013728 [Biomphalaria pfeifferi]